MVHFRNSFLIYCVCSSFVDVKWISLSVFGFFNWTKSKKNNVVQFGKKTLGCKSSKIRCVLECAPLKSTTNLKAISTHSRINSKWSVILLESIENSQQISTFFIYIHSHRIRKKNPTKYRACDYFIYSKFLCLIYIQVYSSVPFFHQSDDVWHCLVLFSSIFSPILLLLLDILCFDFLLWLAGLFSFLARFLYIRDSI